MNSLMIALALLCPFIVLVLLFAHLCGMWDHDEIRRRMELQLPSLDHGPMWRARTAGVAALAVGICCIHGVSWWSLPCLLAMGAGMFSFYFRLRLNKLRGPLYHWCYISPKSNLYDRCFFRLAFDEHDNLFSDVTSVHEKIYFSKQSTYSLPGRILPVTFSVPVYRGWVHRAGRNAYTFEAIVTLASLAVYIYVNC